MIRHGFKALACLVLVLGLVSASFAAVSQTVVVNATIPSVNTLTVTVSKVVGTTWTTQTSINFGTLVLDPVNNIFKTSDASYYAVDVGVNSNAAWTITHTRTSVISGANNLDGNINVSFIQQNATTGVDLSKVSFANSNNVAYTKAAIGTGNWLRIYYGLGTGLGDNTGVTPIDINKPTGAYTGSVTLTLTP